MTAKPIIFSAPMVRAIIAGRKTQTRRVLNPQPNMMNGGHPLYDGRGSYSVEGGWKRMPFCHGDRLWVRETWRPIGDAPLSECVDHRDIRFRATVSVVEDAISTWRSPIYMPRWASRIELLVTDVRVQRLHDIEGQHPTESDAIAEGVNAIHHGDGAYYYSAFRDRPNGKNWGDPFDAFRELWTSIHGAGAWEANPWVAAIRFERVTP